MAAINPSGGVQAIRVPFRPLVGIGEGTYVVVDDDDGIEVYAQVVRARMERRHGQWAIFLYVEPVPTGTVLTGFGELAVDVRPVEVVQ